MKRKRAKQKHKLPAGLLLMLAAFSIGVILWINWSHIREFIQPEGILPISRQVTKPSQEEIREQERKDLDKILKRR
jgi:hypothetical protein